MSKMICYPKDALHNMNRTGINPRASLQSRLKTAQSALADFVKVAWTFTSVRMMI